MLTGNNVMIGGFTIGGSPYWRIQCWNCGMSTGLFLLLTTNGKDPQQAAIQATRHAPAHDKESAVVITRTSTNTTAIVQGKNNTPGNALVEVCTLPQ